MRKRYIALLVLAVVVMVGFAGLCHFGERYMISEGNIFFSTSGDPVFVGENGPIVFSDGSKKGELFAELTKGDGVKIIHGPVEETYPGRSTAYLVLKSDITPDEKARNDIQQLKEMGWLTVE